MYTITAENIPDFILKNKLETALKTHRFRGLVSYNSILSVNGKP